MAEPPQRHLLGHPGRTCKGKGWRLVGRDSRPEDEPQVAPLDHAVDDILGVQGLGQHRASALVDPRKMVSPAFDVGRQRRWMAKKQHFAIIQQQDLVALLGLIQIGGRPDHSDAVGDQFLDHSPQLPARDRVDADARLVEQKQAWLLEQRTCKAQLLLHAAGERARQPAGKGFQVREREQPVELLSTFAADDPPKVGIEVQVLLHGQVFVEPKALRHVTGKCVNRIGFFAGIEAGNGDGAVVGRQEADD